MGVQEQQSALHFGTACRTGPHAATEPTIGSTATPSFANTVGTCCRAFAPWNTTRCGRIMSSSRTKWLAQLAFIVGVVLD